MKRPAMKSILIAAIGIGALSGSPGRSVTGEKLSAADERALHQLGARYSAAVSNSDVAKLTNLFSENATLTTADGASATGQKDIHRVLATELEADPAADGLDARTPVKATVKSISAVSEDTAVLDVEEQRGDTVQTTLVAVREGRQWRIGALRAFSDERGGMPGIGGSGELERGVPCEVPTHPFQRLGDGREWW